MTSRTEEALNAAEKALTRMESGNMDLLPVVLMCLRVANLTGRRKEEKWLQCELRGYGPHVVSDWAQYAEWSGRRAYTDKDGEHFYRTKSIEEIEAELELALSELHSAKPLDAPVPEPKEPRYDYIGQTATERVIARADAKRLAKAPEVLRLKHIVATLRGTLHDWLTRTVFLLRYGSVIETALDQTKTRFDKLLSDKAPDAGRALAAAFSRARSDDPEEWSQALSSCRRALKALADALYPPTDEQPGGRELGEEQYKNRLIQYAAEHLQSTSQEALFIAEIDMVAHRADALNDLASKGVHSSVNARDLELAVVHTYLLAGELLGLTEEVNSAAEADGSDDESSISDSGEQP